MYTTSLVSSSPFHPAQSHQEPLGLKLRQPRATQQPQGLGPPQGLQPQQGILPAQESTVTSGSESHPRVFPSTAVSPAAIWLEAVDRSFKTSVLPYFLELFWVSKTVNSWRSSFDDAMFHVVDSRNELRDRHSIIKKPVRHDIGEDGAVACSVAL
jgi:hypothetical protein